MFGDRVVAWGPAEDVPGDGVGDVVVFQFPNVSGQLCASAFFSVVKVGLVSSPSCFECVTSQPSVALDVTIVVPDNPGLVDDALLVNAAEVG